VINSGVNSEINFINNIDNSGIKSRINFMNNFGI